MYQESGQRSENTIVEGVVSASHISHVAGDSSDSVERKEHFADEFSHVVNDNLHLDFTEHTEEHGASYMTVELKHSSFERVWELGLSLWSSGKTDYHFRFRSETEITMAAGQNVPELGGYDFEFTSKVPEELECPVCQLTMKDPIEIEGCGHRFCSLYNEGLVSPHNIALRVLGCAAGKILKRGHSPKCPVDRQPLSRDKNHQSGCLLKVVECPNAGCQERFAKHDKNNNSESECSWRKVNSKYCGESYIVRIKQ
ncbi:TNF receptor-associated factor 4, partial [Stylophora pistillata]